MIVPLVADCLTQLSDSLIVAPATISCPAVVPAPQCLVSTPDAQLATLLPNVSVTRFDSLRPFATSVLDITLHSPSSSTPSQPPGLD